MTHQNSQFGRYDDLIAELEYKLQDILSHIKLISNTTAIAKDFEITPQNINSLALTLHDKTINAIFITEKLKTIFENKDKKL